MASLRSDVTDQDLAAAQEQAQDGIFEAKVLAAASSPHFWDPIISEGVLDTKQRGILIDWLTAALEGHNQADYIEENGTRIAQLIGTLLQSSAVSHAPDNGDFKVSTVDVALAVLSIFFRTTSNPVDDVAVQARADIFRDIAALAWATAADEPQFRALNKRVEAEFAAAQAKTAAQQAELEISGHKQEAQLAASAGLAPKAPTRLVAHSDLSELGPLRDDEVFQSLLTVLTTTNNEGKPVASGFQLRKATLALSTILAKKVPGSHPAFRHYFRWLRAAALWPQTQLAALLSLKALLKNPDLHLAFEVEQTVQPLTAILKRETKNMQPLYLAGFCVWLLTFNVEMDGVLHNAGVVAALTGVLKVVVREKVVRIALATLTNLLGRSHFTEEMVGVDLHRLAPQLAQRKWKDADIVADVARLVDVLTRRINELSSFELYVAELQAGALRRSPVHNEKFWRTNALKFEDNNFVLVKSLIAQLDSDKEDALEMACYDLGEFARFHPDGKRVIAKFDGKTKLMALMTHRDAAVAKAALLAVQKVLVQKWDKMISAGNSKAAVEAN